MEKLQNYLPQLARNFPKVFIDGIEPSIREIRQTIIEKSSVYRISRELKIKENTLRDTVNCKSLPSLGTLELLQNHLGINLWNEIYNDCKFICGKTYTNKIKIIKELTPEIAYLAGILRDGGLSDYKSELVISQKYREWLESIKNLIENIFGVKITISGPRAKDNCYYIKFRSVALYALIYTIFDYNKHYWKTPEIIKKASQEIQKSYIRGFWEAEGGHQSGVSFYQSGDKESSIPLNDIKDMLAKFGIESWLNGPYKGVNKPMWILYVPKRHASEFFSIFEPRHRKVRPAYTANSDRLKVA